MYGNKKPILQAWIQQWPIKEWSQFKVELEQPRDESF
jgi:hypothetical protein